MKFPPEAVTFCCYLQWKIEFCRSTSIPTFVISITKGIRNNNSDIHFHDRLLRFKFCNCYISYSSLRCLSMVVKFDFFFHFSWKHLAAITLSLFNHPLLTYDVLPYRVEIHLSYQFYHLYCSMCLHLRNPC